MFNPRKPDGVLRTYGTGIIQDLEWDPREWTWRQVGNMKATNFFAYTTKRRYKLGLMEQGKPTAFEIQLRDKGLPRSSSEKRHLQQTMALVAPEKGDYIYVVHLHWWLPTRHLASMNGTCRYMPILHNIAKGINGTRLLHMSCYRKHMAELQRFKTQVQPIHTQFN